MYRSPRDCIDVFSRDGIDVFLYLLTRSTRQLPTSSPLMKWKGEQIFICFLSFVNHIMYESFEISSPRRQTVARHLEAGAQIESKGKIFLMTTILVFAGILKIYIYIYTILRVSMWSVVMRCVWDNPLAGLRANCQKVFNFKYNLLHWIRRQTVQ